MQIKLPLNSLEDVAILNSTNDKRNWISPKLDEWEIKVIKLSGGSGADGGLQAYID